MKFLKKKACLKFLCLELWMLTSVTEEIWAKTLYPECWLVHYCASILSRAKNIWSSWIVLEQVSCVYWLEVSLRNQNSQVIGCDKRTTDQFLAYWASHIDQYTRIYMVWQHQLPLGHYILNGMNVFFWYLVIWLPYLQIWTENMLNLKAHAYFLELNVELYLFLAW